MTIGTKYWKARYYRYTDSTFTTRYPTSARWQHLGILGPILYCEVGDTLQIVLLNSAMYSYSIHVHGLFYSKADEGETRFYSALRFKKKKKKTTLT